MRKVESSSSLLLPASVQTNWHSQSCPSLDSKTFGRDVPARSWCRPKWGPKIKNVVKKVTLLSLCAAVVLELVVVVMVGVGRGRFVREEEGGGKRVEVGSKQDGRFRGARSVDGTEILQVEEQNSEDPRRENRSSVVNDIESAKRDFKDNVLHKKMYSRKQLMCVLKKLPPMFVHPGSDFLANWTKWKALVPREPLFGGETFETCAAVSNSGAMRNSRLGEVIDGHDLILRFNDAVTDGHEADVGRRRPTLRLINGQLPLRWGKRRRELTESLLLPSTEDNNNNSNDGDPSSSSAALVFWHDCCCGLVRFADCLELEPETGAVRKVRRDGDESPDGIRTYFRTVAEYGGRRIYLLEYEYVYELWEFLQTAYGRALAQDRPPSSGFIGIMVLLHLCDKVHAYEFVPSKTRNPGPRVRCHYYNPGHDAMNKTADATCDIYGSGRWHPLSAEKSILYQLNVGSDQEVFDRGVVTIPGLSQIDCG